MKKRIVLVLLICFWALLLFGQNAPAGNADIMGALTGAAENMAALVRQELGSGRTVQRVYIQGITYNSQKTQLGDLFGVLLLSRLSGLGLTNLEFYGTEVRPPAEAGAPYYAITGTAITVGSSLHLGISLKKMPENRVVRMTETNLPVSQDLNRLLAPSGISAGDAYEPNNSPDMAYPLEPNSRLTDLSFDPERDVDWFSFTIAQPVSIRVGTEGDQDTQISLYGPDSPAKEIAFDDDGGYDYNAMITTHLEAPGTYYIEVWPYDSGSKGPYTLFLETLNLSRDQDEPNDQRTQAKSLDVSTLPRNLTLFPRGDQDWYKLNLSSFLFREGEILEIYTSGDLDTYMELYQGNELILSDDDGASSGDYNARLAFSPLRGQDYYLVIRGYDDSEIGEYQLNVQTTIVQLDKYEPNDTKTTATRIGVGETQHGHRLSPYDTVDWFVFELSARSRLSVGTLGDLDTLITLYDANASYLYDDDDSGEEYNATLDVTLERGTYYIEVTQYYNDDGEYSIFVTRQ